MDSTEVILFTFMEWLSAFWHFLFALKRETGPSDLLWYKVLLKVNVHYSPLVIENHHTRLHYTTHLFKRIIKNAIAVYMHPLDNVVRLSVLYSLTLTSRTSQKPAL